MFARPSGIVTLTTDFGVADPYVGIMKGALLAASAKANVVDLSHGVPAQDIASGAFVLWSAIGRFPSGTVHVGVVDPGVGTARRRIAAAAHDQYWIAPDNGLLGAVLASDPAAEVRELDLDHLRVQRTANTFDGRDVFAPVAAFLSAGRYGFTALGRRVDDADAADPVFAAGDRVVYVDHYGNLITSVSGERRLDAPVFVADREVMVHRAYGDVAPGELLAYVGSFGLLEIAARDGS
ncbi:MAG: SAM-dependent chlorinase/fluorinase, partial [Planctomycetes bacterium]|nr:SAM-dependent chlorinase/fluorinase [Planctomycetota bacterium]